jgi:hypothetical protein
MAKKPSEKRSTDSKDMMKPQPLKGNTFQAYAIRLCQFVDGAGRKRISHPSDDPSEREIFNVKEDGFSVRNMCAVDDKVQKRMEAKDKERKQAIADEQTRVRNAMAALGMASTVQAANLE